jgi:phosphohistidine phosphatase SixA
MKLLIMRHGEAMPMADSDANRALTAWGVEQSQAAARLLVEKSHRPELLLVSPLLRAQQTASEVAKEAYNQAAMVNQETVAFLSPDGAIEDLVGYLEQRGETEIMLVSHQPLVSLLIAFFSGEQVGMSTANVALVELNSWKRLSGDLKWVI